MRWDSPPVLVVVGTLAIHTLLLTAGDAVATYQKFHPEVAPEMELFEIDDPPPEPPRLPDLPKPAPEKHDDPLPAPAPVHVAHVASAPVSHAPPIDTPPDPSPPKPGPGGETGPPLQMPDLGPAARDGYAKRGPSNGGHGGGGHGTGTGSGTGDGSGSAAPVPMSVATIKTRALPRGDYSYFGAGKDYPAEAKSLGIEGVIRVRLLVDADGRVTSATPLNRLEHGLDELADRYAHAILFDPARDTDNKPVASVVVWTFQFTLPK